jgi:hypothetical protein
MTDSTPIAVGASDRPPIVRPGSLTDQWRTHLKTQRQQTTTVVALDLPSGMTVRAIRPSLLQLLGTGRIPDALVTPVQELIALGALAAGEDGTASAIRRQVDADPVGYGATFLGILDAVWLAAVVEPVFAADDRADALPVGSVSIADKTFVFVWAQGVDQSVSQFLDGSARSGAVVGSAPDGDRLRARPGDPGRDRPAG